MVHQYLDIGEIINTHGISGELKVLPLTEIEDRFDKIKHILIADKNGNYENYIIESVRYHKEFVLLKLEGIDSIEKGEALKGKLLSIPRREAEQLPDGTYFICDILGSKVYEVGGRLLGTLIDVFETGSNDVYVVKREGKKDLLIPALDDVVKEIDIEKEIIVVELLEGLE